MISGNVHRIEGGVRRGAEIHLDVDGQSLIAYEGETVAAALLAAGRRVLRHTAGDNPRGIFCGMGICSECMVYVEGKGNVNACVTSVREGMRIRTVSGSTHGAQWR